MCSTWNGGFLKWGYPSYHPSQGWPWLCIETTMVTSPKVLTIVSSSPTVAARAKISASLGHGCVCVSYIGFGWKCGSIYIYISILLCVCVTYIYILCMLIYIGCVYCISYIYSNVCVVCVYIYSVGVHIVCMYIYTYIYLVHTLNLHSKWKITMNHWMLGQKIYLTVNAIGHGTKSKTSGKHTPWLRRLRVKKNISLWGSKGWPLLPWCPLKRAP